MSQVILSNILQKISRADDLHEICDRAFMYRELSVQSYPERFVASFSSKFSCTKGEIRQFVHHLSKVVMAAIMILSDPEHNPTQLGEIYPEKLSSKMKGTLSKYFTAKFSDWKTELVSTNVSYPRFAGAQCATKEGGDNPQQKSCILELKIDNGYGGQAGYAGMDDFETVRVELSQEKVTDMLVGLGKIREQLQTVTQ